MPTHHADRDVRRTLIIGAGSIGMELAAQCVAHGVAVNVFDVDPEAVAEGPRRLERTFREMGTLGPADPASATRAATFTSAAVVAAQDVDLACECVPEQLPLKRRVLGEFDRLLPPSAILTTTSSYFLPSMLVAGLGRRDRFAAFHVHSPVWLAAVADIMPHGATSAECVGSLERFARRIGQIPIVLRREHPGYVFNSMLRVLLMSALTLAERDVATPEDVDRAWMGVTGMPVGPFGMLDRIGLETVRDIARYWGGVMRDPQIVRNGEYLQRLIDAGRTGRRSGRGFYFHPGPAYEEGTFLGRMRVPARGDPETSRAERETRAGQIPPAPGGDATEPMLRCELTAVPAPLPRGDARPPSGVVMIHGGAPLAPALAARLRSAGLEVVVVPGDSTPERMAPLFAAVPGDTPCHLVLAAAWTDRVEPIPTPVAWRAETLGGIESAFALCQAWYGHGLGKPWLARAAVVGVTSLGGDVGASGRIATPTGGAITGLLKAVFMESRAGGAGGPAVRIVDGPAGDRIDAVADRVLAEMTDALASSTLSPEEGFARVEVGYRRDERYAIRLVPRPTPAEGPRISPGGQWLVTGGARGITAEVARRLAVRFGLRLVLLGTTPPGDEPWERLDARALEALKRDVMIGARASGRKPNEAWDVIARVIEVRRNLAALQACGIEASYHVCRIDDPEALRDTLSAVRASAGPFRGVIHGAGFEHTGRFDRKTPAEVHRTLGGKVNGLVGLVDVLRHDPLEAFVAFGSLTGRCGGVGQTDYALANDLLAKLVTHYRSGPGGTAAATIHWPGWADVGMAARPASRRALEGGGQRLMSIDEGCRHAIAEIVAGLPAAEVVIVDRGVLPPAMFLT
jgi:3-hydroxybutyryl-CoA dehydrogenase